MLRYLSFCLSFIVLGIWLMIYNSIHSVGDLVNKIRFVKFDFKNFSAEPIHKIFVVKKNAYLVLTCQIVDAECPLSTLFLQMEKLRFVSPIYEKSQSWQEI